MYVEEEEDDNDAIIMLLIAGSTMLLDEEEMKKREERRWQVRPVNQRTALAPTSEFEHFMRVKELDKDIFFQYTRMERRLFDILLEKMTPMLYKDHSRAICPEEKLAITLKYLAHGGSLAAISFSFRRGLTTVWAIVNETCMALWETLKDVYVKSPTQEDWEESEEGFRTRWNLPNCIGALDGKSFNVRAPPKSGSSFYGYKKTFSIGLMALANPKYEFTYVEVGSYGSQHDAGVFANTEFGRYVTHDPEALEIPGPSLLPNTRLPSTHYIVGDEAFPLLPNLMRPYPGKHLDQTKRIFNYRLSRGRRIIENVFGILVARWQIFHQTLAAGPSNVENMILATIALHNFIMKSYNSFSSYCPSHYVDRESEDGSIIPGGFRRDLPPDVQRWLEWKRQGSNNSTKLAMGLRNLLAAYYVSDQGSVPWQNSIVFKKP